MKKQNFFSWYWSEGIKDFLEIEKNIILFFWSFFSMKDLFTTLFSPWKRDLTGHYWRGFQPLKSLETLIENLISRIIGAIVRSIVIAMGLALTVVVSVLGFMALLVWIAPPAVLVLFFVPGLPFFFTGLATLALIIVYVLIVMIVYEYSASVPYAQMDLAELAREKWFRRVWARLGAEEGGSAGFNPEKLPAVLESAELSQEEFNNIINWEIKIQEEKDKRGKFWLAENLEKINPVGRQWKYAYTVNLDRYSLDLSVSDPTDYRNKTLVGRENELDLVNLVLSRPDQNNLLLVGDAGIGRTTLIHHLANLARSHEGSGFLQSKRLLVLDLGRVISEAANENRDVESELNLIFREAAYAGNVILVIKNIENFLGKEGAMFHPDVSTVMDQYLELPTFQILATSTNKEYHQLIEKHEGFMKYFEVVEMKEPTEDQAAEILLNNFKDYERNKIIFTYKALKHTVASSGKYHWDVPLPERAIDLAQETLTFWGSQGVSPLITPEVVDEFVSLKTGAPQGEVKADEREKLLGLENIMHQRVIGQVEAIRQVAEALRRARSGISDPKKPIGSFLFLGPTGVGKTETAKALAEGYFGGEEKMIRLDMSEFQSPLSIDRLVGSSQMNQPGQLVNLAKDNPFSLLLLDELEKAHPQILDLFLQVLDEGFITDAFGEKINFRNMIIIATSNAGSQLIKKMVEENQEPEELKQLLIDYLVENNIFRLEFMNRFDGIIFFRPLNESELVDVVNLMLEKLTRRLAREKHLKVNFEDGVVGKIIDQGYSHIFGARSLNRFIEDKVENLIARKIISGETHKGEPISITVSDFA